MSNQTQIQKPLRGSGHVAASKATKDEQVYVSLPKDMYLHTPTSQESPSTGCPTEWWWHIGTLKSVDGSRTFGFEINACALYNDNGGFTEVMLTDVENAVHYRESKTSAVIPGVWAEYDITKPWFVALNNVLMTTGENNKLNPSKHMVVQAKLEDKGKVIDFDLNLKQEGKPLFVFGTGRTPIEPPHTKASLKNNNYYFSLTRLNVTGTIKFRKAGSDSDAFEEVQVVGTTWMDHEWGNFSKKGSSSNNDVNKPSDSVKWILQDMQFENGITLSNFALKMPVLGQPTAGRATVQLSAEDDSLYVPSTMTPKKSFFIGTKEYFTEIDVNIPSLGIEATVNTLLKEQLFKGGIYEGVATVKGKMTSSTTGSQIDTVLEGTAWIEQFIF